MLVNMNKMNNLEKNLEESSDDEERCPVCLDFQTCDSIIMECCNKLIHADCLIQWLRRKNNCPLCRTEQSTYYNTPTNTVITNSLENALSSINNLFNSIDIGITQFNIGITQPSIGVSRRRNATGHPYLLNRQNVWRRSSILFSDFNNFNNGISFNNNLINNLDEIFDDNFINDIEAGITVYQNNNENIGISFVNSNDNLIGISYLNIENDDINNSLNININGGDLNINFNNDSLPLYLQLMRNFVEDINNTLNQSDTDFDSDFDPEEID